MKKKSADPSYELENLALSILRSPNAPSQNALQETTSHDKGGKPAKKMRKR
jgi:hypothetical protein